MSFYVICYVCLLCLSMSCRVHEEAYVKSVKMKTIYSETQMIIHRTTTWPQTVVLANITFHSLAFPTMLDQQVTLMRRWLQLRNIPLGVPDFSLVINKCYVGHTTSTLCNG
jgi:hypothetical protein